MTGDKELEITNLLEFKHGKRPEEAIQGNVIRFMYSSNSDPSAYWLQETLNARIDELETAVKSGWRKKCFEVNKISIIKHWGDLKPLPTTIVVNLTNETAIKTMNLISDDGKLEEPDG